MLALLSAHTLIIIMMGVVPVFVFYLDVILAQLEGFVIVHAQFMAVVRLAVVVTAAIIFILRFWFSGFFVCILLAVNEFISVFLVLEIIAAGAL